MNRGGLLTRLAIRSLRRNGRDYTVCCATITLTVTLLFAFNAAATSPRMQALSKSMVYYEETLTLTSWIVTIAAGLLIDYNARFLLEKRGNELAVCLTLGMERRQAALLFLGELVLAGLLAGLAGIGLGAILFQLLASVLMGLFQSEYYHLLGDCFRLPALGRTLAHFLLLYLAAGLHTLHTLKRTGPAALQQRSRRRESRPGAGSWLWLLLLLPSLALCGLCLWWIRMDMLLLQEARTCGPRIVLGILAGVLGIPGVYFSGMRLLPRLLGGKRLLKGANLFLARQLTARLGSDSLLMGIGAVLTTLSLACMGVGGYYAVMELSQDSIEDFELLICLDDSRVDFSPQLELLSEYGLEDWTVFTVDKTQSPEALRLFQGISREQLGYYQDGAMVISQSDFNSLLRQSGGAAVELGDREYFLSVNSAYNAERARENLLPSLELGGASLSPWGEGAGMKPQGPWAALLVLPDPVCQAAREAGELEFARKGLAAVTREEIPEEDELRFLGEPLFIAVSPDGDASFYSVGEGSRVDASGGLIISYVQDGQPGQITARYAGYGYVDEAGKPVAAFASVQLRSANIATRRASVSAGCSALFYLGIVLGMIAAAILAVQQLSDREQSRRRFRLLGELGLGEGEIRRLAARQLAAFFGLPLVVPAAMITPVMALLEVGFLRYAPFRGLWLVVLSAVLGLFLLVYGGYFLLALLGYERNILEE